MESIVEKFNIATAFNHIELRRCGNRVELLSPGDAMQSVIDLEHPERLQLGNLEHLMAIQLFLPPPRRILLLGTAAGSLLHYLRHHHPGAEITAVDIDQDLVEQMLARGYLEPPDDRLAYVYADAREFIAREHSGYDLVLVDIFTGAQSPRWLGEREVLEHLRRLLGARGAVGFNLLIGSDHDFRQFYRGLRRVFDGKTLCLPVAGFENTICYAFRASPPARDLGGWTEQADRRSEELGIDLRRLLAVIYNTNPVGGGIL